MNLPLSQSILCPQLIGREIHLEIMEQFPSQAGAGYGQTILVAGEAGWGKSRLVAEFKTRAAHQNWRIWQGYCFENERALPYALVVDWLRQVAHVGQIPEELAPNSASH